MLDRVPFFPRNGSRAVGLIHLLRPPLARLTPGVTGTYAQACSIVCMWQYVALIEGATCMALAVFNLHVVLE